MNMEDALRPLLQETGDVIAAMIEQMQRGNWTDDHGHDVRFNTAMMACAVLLVRLAQFRAKHLGYSEIG